MPLLHALSSGRPKLWMSRRVSACAPVAREHDAGDLADRLFRHVDQALGLGRVIVLHIHMVKAQRALRAVVIDRDVEHIGKLGLHDAHLLQIFCAHYTTAATETGG